MFWKQKKIAPPTGLHLETNKTCNSRCKTCMMWMTKEDSSKQLLDSRYVEIVEEFAELNPAGRVFICGGETLMKSERLLAMTRRCNALGLGSQTATNGSLVDEELAKRIAIEGPAQIAISLNSHHGRVHDYTRGRPGSFEEVCRAIGLLQDARRRYGRDFRIHVHSIVCELNYRDLEDFHAFVLSEMAVDRVDVGFLQPTFHLAGAAGQDRFFAKNIVRDEDKLCGILERCDRRFALKLAPAWIEQIRMYHRSIREHGQSLRGWAGRHGTEEHICATYDRNIMVTCEGVARLCYSPCFRGVKLRRQGDLARFWRRADDIRRKMKACRAYCGMVEAVSRVRPRLETAPEADRPLKAA